MPCGRLSAQQHQLNECVRYDGSWLAYCKTGASLFFCFSINAATSSGVPVKGPADSILSAAMAEANSPASCGPLPNMR